MTLSPSPLVTAWSRHLAITASEKPSSPASVAGGAPQIVRRKRLQAEQFAQPRRLGLVRMLLVLGAAQGGRERGAVDLLCHRRFIARSCGPEPRLRNFTTEAEIRSIAIAYMLAQVVAKVSARPNHVRRCPQHPQRFHNPAHASRRHRFFVAGRHRRDIRTLRLACCRWSTR